MGSIKEIDIKNRTHYFLASWSILKTLIQNLLKNRQKVIPKHWYLLYQIHKKYLYTIKNIGDYESIHSVNLLYFTIGEVDGYIEEKNGNKYLTFASTDKSREVLTKYTELWDETENLIEKIHNKSGEYGKDFIKIKFDLDDNLPLNKILKLHNLTITFRSVF